MHSDSFICLGFAIEVWDIGEPYKSIQGIEPKWVYMSGCYPAIMAPTAADLIDEHSEREDEIKLALRIARVKEVTEKSSIYVPIPESAIEFSKNVLSQWLDDVAKFARSRRGIPYLADRKEHLSDVFNTELDWNQGISKEELQALHDELVERDSGYVSTYPTIAATGPFGQLQRRQLTVGPLSGHYNRFLPMKLVLRVLLNLIYAREKYEGEEEWMEEREPVYIDMLREHAIDIAVFARKWFATVDARSGKSVGEEITVGFPDEKPKSQERFLTQFVGSTRTKGKGALCEMGFILVEDDGSIELTYEGLLFALSPNPMIDMTPEGGRGVRTSQDEQWILMRHIQSHLPAEWEFMSKVASTINQGVNRPKELDQSLMDEFDWDESKANNMRNGVVSRMQELGFLTRQKEGRNITYHLTDNGNLRLVKGELWGDARQA